MNKVIKLPLVIKVKNSDWKIYVFKKPSRYEYMQKLDNFLPPQKYNKLYLERRSMLNRTFSSILTKKTFLQSLNHLVVFSKINIGAYLWSCVFALKHCSSNVPNLYFFYTHH